MERREINNIINSINSNMAILGEIQNRLSSKLGQITANGRELSVVALSAKIESSRNYDGKDFNILASIVSVIAERAAKVNANITSINIDVFNDINLFKKTGTTAVLDIRELLMSNISDSSKNILSVSSTNASGNLNDVQSIENSVVAIISSINLLSINMGVIANHIGNKNIGGVTSFINLTEEMVRIVSVMSNSTQMMEKILKELTVNLVILNNIMSVIEAEVVLTTDGEKPKVKELIKN